jgi:hypothetical protein
VRSRISPSTLVDRWEIDICQLHIPNTPQYSTFEGPYIVSVTFTVRLRSDEDGHIGRLPEGSMPQLPAGRRARSRLDKKIR